jgi:hypothetical protein
MGEEEGKVDERTETLSQDIFVLGVVDPNTLWTRVESVLAQFLATHCTQGHSLEKGGMLVSP